MNIESRIKLLEQRAAEHARKEAERRQFCGAIPLVWRDGFISGCMYIPCDRVPAYSEMASLTRKKATCPDIESCEYSDVCRSGDTS